MGQSQEELAEKSRSKPRRSRRLTVDLEGDAVDQFEQLLEGRNLSISQAVRQALSLLALFDDERFELILRDKEDKLPDQRIILLR